MIQSEKPSASPKVACGGKLRATGSTTASSQRRSGSGEQPHDTVSDLARVLHSDAGEPNRLGELGEVGVGELDAKRLDPGLLHLDVDEPKSSVIEHDELDRQPALAIVSKSPIIIVRPPSPQIAIDWRPGNASAIPSALGIAWPSMPMKRSRKWALVTLLWVVDRV
jgi:hypothetical protein